MKNDVQQKLAQWRKSNNSYLNEIKELLAQMKSSKDIQIISYFTYSLNISHEPESDNICLGSFHIQNLGNQPLTNPYICIKLSPDAPFHFSGKYVYKNSNQKMKVSGAWERMNEQSNKEEFWLRPIGKQEILPNEVLSFPNFQVKWTASESYAGSVMGFAYGEERKEGMTAFNQINISGKTGKRGEGNEPS